VLLDTMDLTCTSMELSTVSLSGSEYEEDKDFKEKTMRKTKCYNNGRLPYLPKTYPDPYDLQKFNVYQEHTRHAYRCFQRKEKKEKNSQRTLWLVSAKTKLHHKIAYGVNGAERLIDGVESKERWRDLFGNLHNKLHKAIFCFLYNESSIKMYHGEAFISSTLVGFFCLSEQKDGCKGLRLCIPYEDIHAITKAGIIYPDKKKTKPQIIPLNNAVVKPSVIQLWTTLGEVHQLYGFGPFYDQIYNSLFTTWKVQKPEI